MGISIREVKDHEDLKTFIYLPEKIHEHHPAWLPPLYLDEEKFFSIRKNPAFRHNPHILFLAFENKRPVGRIMGVIPVEYNRMHHSSCARFSYLECYENKEIFDALIHAVEDWAKKQQANELIGPMGFSDKEPQGFLMKGFEGPTMMVTNCSFPFMADWIRQDGYAPFLDLCQYDVPISKEIFERYKNYTQRVEDHLHVHILEFSSTKDVKPYIKPIFDLINRTYQEIYGFSSISDEERDEFAERFLPLLNAQLIKIITDKDNNVVAFVVAMPDFSGGLRKAKGRIFPFGWFHIWRSARKSKRLVLLLGSIEPAMQNKGLDAILATRLFASAIRLGFKTVDSHIIMRDNHKMRAEIERLQGYNMYKEYSIFRKSL